MLGMSCSLFVVHCWSLHKGMRKNVILTCNQCAPLCALAVAWFCNAHACAHMHSRTPDSTHHTPRIGRCKRLYVGNIPFSIKTSEDLKQHFPGATQISLPVHADTQRFVSSMLTIHVAVALSLSRSLFVSRSCSLVLSLSLSLLRARMPRMHTRSPCSLYV